VGTLNSIANAPLNKHQVNSKTLRVTDWPYIVHGVISNLFSLNRILN
jgi:hypothetical protein